MPNYRAEVQFFVEAGDEEEAWWLVYGMLEEAKEPVFSRHEEYLGHGQFEESVELEEDG